MIIFGIDIEVGKVYTGYTSFHAVKIDRKVYSFYGVEVDMLSYSFYRGIVFPFTTRYGFFFRDWLHRVKDGPEIPRHRRQSYMPKY